MAPVLRRFATLTGLVLLTGASAALAADAKPILIGVNTPIQLQLGRDSVDAIQMGVDEINAKGGVLGRKLKVVVADEGTNPQQGVAAVEKLTEEEHVDVLIGGANSGVTLAEEPHIAEAKTIWIINGSSSNANTAFVKKDYKRYKYVFRVNPINSRHLAEQLVGFTTGMLKNELGYRKMALVGENAVAMQEIARAVKAGMEKGGIEVTMMELFDPDTSDFSPLFSKVKASGAQYLVIMLSHANSDVFVKQWHDAKFPLPIGGFDIKSQNPNFCSRIGGKSIGETLSNNLTSAQITPKTVAFWNAFTGRYHRAPVYTGPGGYDALHVYVEAVERAKSTDPEKVIPELEKTKYVGTEGTIEFDESHDVKTGPGNLNLLFQQWQANCTRAVVWPKEVATGKMILPPWIAAKH